MDDPPAPFRVGERIRRLTFGVAYIYVGTVASAWGFLRAYRRDTASNPSRSICVSASG